MNAIQLWNEFKNKCNIEHDEYESWSFGVDVDILANLVIKGEKTATASAHISYEKENEPLPKEGMYNIILNSKEEAICIIKTTKVYVVPFNKVSKEHAYKEGEGDKTLDYWQESHKKFFSECLYEIGEEFNEEMLVVCEEFEVVYVA